MTSKFRRVLDHFAHPFDSVIITSLKLRDIALRHVGQLCEVCLRDAQRFAQASERANVFGDRRTISASPFWLILPPTSRMSLQRCVFIASLLAPSGTAPTSPPLAGWTSDTTDRRQFLHYRERAGRSVRVEGSAMRICAPCTFTRSSRSDYRAR